jgi:hypothetical protein
MMGHVLKGTSVMDRIQIVLYLPRQAIGRRRPTPKIPEASTQHLQTRKMEEDHVNRALCLEDNRIPPSVRDQEHRIPQDAL